MMQNLNSAAILDILRLGLIGLAFILAFLAFRLLKLEQQKPTPRGSILVAVYVFMLFSLALCGFTVTKELKELTLKHERDLQTPEIKWELHAVEGPLFDCYADGEKVGTRLNCHNFGTCNNQEGNTRVCAGYFYPEGIRNARARIAQQAK
jgi:hypothetical protein